MMKNFISAISVLCVGMTMLSSCQEQITAEVEPEKVTVQISVPTADTKITGSVNESSISNYQVFIYNDEGLLEAYVQKTTPDISLECTAGSKTVAVLVNAPAITDGMTLDSLIDRTSLLSDNSAGAFVMSGMVTKTINKSTTSISVQVTRLVARVKLSKLDVAFEMPQYQRQEFKVTSVYLINVPADRRYFHPNEPSLWYHKTEYTSSNGCTLIYDNMSGVAVSETAPYTAQNTFYCYPNPSSDDSFSSTWSPRHTRLVVEGTLDGTVYFYPVTLPQISSNMTYDVQLKITRPGATGPDAEVDKFAAGVTVTVKDWETGATVVEEI